MASPSLTPLKEKTTAPPARSGVPPLHPRDRLSRAEFERRYLAQPDIKKAELIEGVVYMPSPTRYQQHGRPHSLIITWLGIYEAATPGVFVGDNTSVRLDRENEVQPDALLRLDTSLGGRSRITEDDYLEGPPELIVDVAAGSAAYDLHDKKRVYARNGVQEYIAVQVYEQRIDWFALHDDVYVNLATDENGLMRSECFPGLWLSAPALWSRPGGPTAIAAAGAGLCRARRLPGPMPGAAGGRQFQLGPHAMVRQ